MNPPLLPFSASPSVTNLFASLIPSSPSSKQRKSFDRAGNRDPHRSSPSSYPASLASSGLMIMARTLRRLVLAINCNNWFGRRFFPVTEFQVIGPSCPLRRSLRAVVWRLQSITTCVADFSAVPHSHGVGRRIGVLSTAVRDSLSRVMVVANLLFRRLVGSNGLIVGALSRLYSSVHREIIRCLGCNLSQLRVVRVHWHSLSFKAAFAAVSACLFPLTSWCDGLHFPSILHPFRCRVCASQRHSLTYSLPAVGLPDQALSAF